MALQTQSFQANRRTILIVSASIFVIAIGILLPRIMPIAAPQPITAADTTTSSAPVSIETPALSMTVGKIIVGISIIAGTCLLIMKRFAHKPVIIPGGALEFYSALAIDPLCTVSLVRAGTKRMLIGHDVSGVKVMLELPGPLLNESTQVIGPIRMSPIDSENSFETHSERQGGRVHE